MEDIMKEEKQLPSQTGVQAKKAYTKPTLSQIHLVAEEAVLSVCKSGGFGECRPALLNCSYNPSS